MRVRREDAYVMVNVEQSDVIDVAQFVEFGHVGLAFLDPAHDAALSIFLSPAQIEDLIQKIKTAKPAVEEAPGLRQEPPEVDE